MRLPILLLAILLAGCASKKNPDALNTATANTRALEQVRMRAVTTGEMDSARGAQVLVADPNKEFDPSTARFGSSRTFGTRAARTPAFNFEDRVRTKSFISKEYASKSAWMGDAKFATKDAPTKTSWFARRTAATKSYGTREAHDAGKSAETRALPDGERAFLVQGRKQALFDAKGPEAVPYGTNDAGPSWLGELKEIGGARPLTIDQVKRLLNKN